MPPRRKAAKKNVRTPKSKAKPESPTPPPDPATLPDTKPEPEHAAVSDETPVSDDAEISTAATELVAAVQETLAVAETLGTEEKPDSATETLAEEPAGTEIQETATEVAPASAETEKKKTTRKVTVVKKVIKKKIVKKLVPKAAALAKEEDKVVEEKAGEAENPKEEITEVVTALETIKEEEKKEEGAEVAQKIVKEAEKRGEITEVVLETKKEEEKKEEIMVMAIESVKEEEKKEECAKMVSETVNEEEKKEEIEEVVPESTKEEEKKGDVEMEEAGVSERKSRKNTEIFVGGLDRDAKEEDLRKVFGKAGEIVEVRTIMDGQSGKNKGYAFVRFADVSQAKKAVTDFEKVEIRGKLCGASAIKGNDTLFLGNIDKKWKKEDMQKLLHEVGIEKIEAVTIMPDHNSAGSNRGFAFVEFETNKDAQNAFKKLQKKDAFGRGLNIKIAWAEPLNDPDEEEVKKVKSVYAEGIPPSWNEEKLRESFKKFGEIERIVLARNIKSAKRKDFAFVNYNTRAAALLCIKSFDKEELTDNGSKVNVKVSLAKPAQKGKQSKVGSKYTERTINKEKLKAVQRDTKASISYNAVNHPNRGIGTNANGTRSSTNHELLHVLREQATWKPVQAGHAGGLFNAGGPGLRGYPHGVGGKRPFSSLGGESFYSDPRGHPRPRPDSFPGASHGSMPHGMVGSSHPHYQRQDPGYAPAGSYFGHTDPAATHQMRQGAPPYGSSSYYPGGPRHGF